MHIGFAIRPVLTAIRRDHHHCGLAAGAATQDLQARGAYLVNTIAACGNCHTPKDAMGQAIAAQELAGGVEFDIPPAHVVGPNIDYRFYGEPAGLIRQDAL